MSSPAKIVDLNLPVVALVGRVNVGKSSLFNRLTETDKAIVSDVPGTTRTRNEGIVIWRGRNFKLVDTGGLTFSHDIPLEAEVVKQSEFAVKEADVIVLVADIQSGILPQEKELAKRLQKIKSNKPVIFVANKADSARLQAQNNNPEWLSLGLGAPLPISASNGVNTGDLLDLIYAQLDKKGQSARVEDKNPSIKVTIAGRPNVGKSLLFNKLIGQDKVIVSSIAHTTREPHDTLVEFEGQKILFIDTAGIRRKQKVEGTLERQGIYKSLETVDEANVVLFILDAADPISEQDKHLAGYLRAHAKSAILVINKWDLAEGNEDSFRNEVKSHIYKELPHLDYAPIVFVSALSNYRVHQIFPLIIQAQKARETWVDKEELKNFLNHVVKRRLPLRGRGTRHPEILELTQLSADPPVFEMLIKAQTSLHISYAHYIERELREQFGFFATPLIMKLRKSKKD